MLSYVSYEGKERFYVTMVLWLIVVAMAIAIPAITIDSGGRQPNEHAGPRPSTVVPVYPYEFILRPGAPSPAAVCGSETNFDVGTNLPHLPGLSIVNCSKNVYWDQAGGPSPNFGTALGRTVINRFVIAGLLAWTLFMWTIAMSGAVGDIRQGRRKAKRKVVTEREAITAARADLVSLWSSDKISDLAYEERLQKLLDREAAL